MATFLAEVYLARSRAADADADAARCRVAAEELSREGVPVRCVRTTFLPDDETCFHVFEASSAEAVAEVCVRAGLGRVRVVPVIEASQRLVR